MAHLDDLAFFQHLARAGSLTATARELGLSLSAVSKRLKQLEARLGVELAARTTRRLTLTAEGERYLARGTLILDELDELENSLGEEADQALSGRLRVNATFGFGRRHIAPLLSRFCAEHPEVEGWLELTNFPLNLSDHGFDIGIRIGEPPESRLVARRILANRRVLCASPAYIAQALPIHTPADLQQHECLVIRENDSDFPLWRFEPSEQPTKLVSGKVQSVKVSGRLASNDGEVITRLALDGHGVMLRSWWDVNEHLASGALVELLPGWQGVRSDFYAVFEQRRHVPARLRAFIDYVQCEIARRVSAMPER
ncbi:MULTISPECIES: LysR family transcriptional regulator [unclassified Halomonas]|uniref:LysR family transcriptional regulator n=1 Tax=unclassified Halomonas TaxID=2609666 RepID=UPI0007D97A5A|nr:MULTISPECIES: LysR family transcriptional regulator [unclassified Halomonas]MBT2785469.1 LysR family transcriptional regulator [Halomonas sp. ISL-106]MBT2797847.1 LysR family transcriptional regulator [Halomonas sp. ISL-104]OAL59317.1 LysR family transcriptional regulator [Halomonas sp. ALS9]